MDRTELKQGMEVYYNGKLATVEGKERTCIYVRMVATKKLQRVQPRSLRPAN